MLALALGSGVIGRYIVAANSIGSIACALGGVARRGRAPTQSITVFSRRGRQGHVARALADSLAGHRRNARNRVHRHGHRGRVRTVVGIRTRNRVGRGIGSRDHRDGGACLIGAPFIAVGTIGRQGRGGARTDCCRSSRGRHVRKRVHRGRHGHTGRLTACIRVYLHIVGCIVIDTWSCKARASTSLALGRLSSIPVDSPLIGRGSQGHRAGTTAGSRSHRRSIRNARLSHRHCSRGETAIFGTRHGVGATGRDLHRGIRTEVIGPLVSCIHQAGGGRQCRRSALTDGSCSDRCVVDADTHDRGRVDRQMVGGRSGTTVVVGARHRIVTGCGRGDRRVASHIVGPRVGGGAGGGQRDGIGATGSGGTRDAHIGGIVGRHGHRGGVGTAVGRTGNRIGAARRDVHGGSGTEIVRPSISSSA